MYYSEYVGKMFLVMEFSDMVYNDYGFCIICIG